MMAAVTPCPGCPNCQPSLADAVAVAAAGPFVMAANSVAEAVRIARETIHFA